MSEEQYKFTKQDCIGCREYCELQQENKMLKLDSKNTYETSQDIMYEMQEENEQLKRQLYSPDQVEEICPKCGEKFTTNYSREVYDLKAKNEELTRLVSNKVMADYDYDSILKQQLNEERLKYVALEESKNIVENILTKFEKWLEEDFKNEVEHPTPQIYCNCYSCKIKVLDKLQELKEGKK